MTEEPTVYLTLGFMHHTKTQTVETTFGPDGGMTKDGQQQRTTERVLVHFTATAPEVPDLVDTEWGPAQPQRLSLVFERVDDVWTLSRYSFADVALCSTLTTGERAGAEVRMQWHDWPEWAREFAEGDALKVVTAEFSTNQ